MRILMLGWEFPPFISGGLGTACYGLTRALDRLGHEITFVLPRAVDRALASHVELISPDSAAPDAGVAEGEPLPPVESYRLPGFPRTTFHAIPASIFSPYPERQADALAEGSAPAAGAGASGSQASAPGASRAVEPEPAPRQSAGADYAGDVVEASERYASLALRLCRHRAFDVIHAHDWMTAPAGLWLARATGRPLVQHIHSTEYDRSGVNVHPRIHEIERRAMHGALRVIAVSELTRSICIHRYEVSPEKIDVVYNGVDVDAEPGIDQPSPDHAVRAGDKVVLFLGRITMQKGPEYFIRAAKRVLEKMDNVKFIVAGSGDMARPMIEMAAQMGIGHKVLFTGFLRGEDVRRIFRMADLYVMPSVSEPFGIAPLEAISHDTPALISRQSGVSEVLRHVLKVDFWDVDDMADKILAVLRHPPLSQTLRSHGAFEIRKLTWDGAARRCEAVYNAALASMEFHALVETGRALGADRAASGA